MVVCPLSAMAIKDQAIWHPGSSELTNLSDAKTATLVHSRWS
jgi:hypothetical protein